MMPITRKGNPLIMPIGTYGSGSKAREASMMTARMAKLIHQGERSNTANKEFFAILNFIRCLLSPPATCGCPVYGPVHGVDDLASATRYFNKFEVLLLKIRLYAK
jgi:hypothetical protein